MSRELIERHKGFTPGPWAVDSRVPTSVTAAGNFGICSTGGFQCNFMDPEKLNAKHEANARLIADAPALLAALEAAASRERELEARVAILQTHISLFRAYLDMGDMSSLRSAIDAAMAGEE